MRNAPYITIILAFVFQFYAIADTTITTNTMSFSVNLPEHWVATQVNDSYVTFKDITHTYPSQISIKQFIRNTNIYPLAKDWTRAQFIAYHSAAHSSGTILWYDSSSSVRQGTLLAMEIFSEFNSRCTSIYSWAEYMLFTENGNYGYEIYADGETAESNNLDIYYDILESIRIN